ncbi:MCE family protein [Mycolicibacterium nivoides]|uniref:MCE family protein n=1 Tax=Mycolicibacterium nivoides TaxID=2487344 RepID=UPI0008AC04D3|nr:MlaD family protein [Mycolicibacterium nivoides]SEP59877.1 phospholipid/cholesterol/gamma-HCH transport system substrate-binding protein [Mycobacterium sp. 88mf]SFF04838.1 phospholipid/cholesterol/gamma-HCH transport system substrate-binding protein [Mycobacterium sp. 455mf]
MRLNRRIRLQLALFTVVSVVAAVVMGVGFMEVPARVLGIGQYRVTIELPSTGGLYPSGNVTYRGLGVGRVADVRMTDTGVEADLSLSSDVPIPADVTARVHSRSAIGEQYVELTPLAEARGATLRDGDVIAADRTGIPVDINTILDETNRGLTAIPAENLRTVIDESALAFGGLGPDLARLVRASTKLASGAKTDLGALTTVIDESAPVLDTQNDTADEIRSWAARLAGVTGQLAERDASVRNLLPDGAAAAGEVRQLFERLQPSLPIMLANLAGIGELAVTYQAGVRQVLVLVPQAIAVLGSSLVPGMGVMSAYKGPFVTFDLNLNVPPPCLTGFLPPSQQRSPAFEDYPDRPAGDLYCRVPQDSPFNVRGARNLPCVNNPGKRAPTAKMCNGDEMYVPLNDGFNWKGDPNATTSGQGVPQVDSVPPAPPGPAPQVAPAALAPPVMNQIEDIPIAFTSYNPDDGSYVGPDGNIYALANLAHQRPNQTWQSMLTADG